MRRTKNNNPLTECILRGVEELIESSKQAKSVEFTLKLEAGSVPVISYKVDELQIVPNAEVSKDD